MNMRTGTMEYKWYWHKEKPTQVHVRRGVVGDYWLIPEFGLTVCGNELFDTENALLAHKIDEANNPPTIKNLEEEEIGRATWVPYLRVIDGKKD